MGSQAAPVRAAGPAEPSRSAAVTRPSAAVSPGRPLEPSVRDSMERRFGFDFSMVRVHTDDRARDSAAGLGARAYTLGSQVMFGSGQYAPHTRPGRELLAHELAHVVQGNRPGSAPASAPASEAAIESEADRTAEAVLAGRPARPALAAPAGPHCKRYPGSVPGGQYFVDLEEKPGSAGLQESVRIEFLPDKSGPVTDRITFLQIAQPRTDGKALPWGPSHEGEEIVDRIRTREQTAVHEVKPGDTLATVSTAHYGEPGQTDQLYKANRGLGISPDPQAPLPAGQVLTVPQAVQGDFNLDIRPADIQPRKPGGPNVSGNYPHMGYRARTVTSKMGDLTVTSVQSDRAIGRNPRNGTPESAVMTDEPGGGPTRSTFRFETTAHAEDIGHSYGSVRWGFDYDPSNTRSAGSSRHITNEQVRFTPRTSDTVNAAVAAFNRDVGNRHVVQEQETLRTISLLYYRTSGRAYALFMVNPGILPRFDPDAALPPAKELELPTVWDAAKYGSGGVRPGPAERDTVWDRVRREGG